MSYGHQVGNAPESMTIIHTVLACSHESEASVMYSIVINVDDDMPDDEHVSRIIAILEPQMNHSLFNDKHTLIWITKGEVEPNMKSKVMRKLRDMDDEEIEELNTFIGDE